MKLFNEIVKSSFIYYSVRKLVKNHSIQPYKIFFIHTEC